MIENAVYLQVDGWAVVGYEYLGVFEGVQWVRPIYRIEEGREKPLVTFTVNNSSDWPKLVESGQ
jgi:hypothetical protein